MDLHAWITQQVDETEAGARAHEQASPRWEYDSFVHEIRDLDNAGTVASVYRDGTGAHIERHDPAAVLRRCEADRRILARHSVDPAQSHSHLFATACEGCGTQGVCDDPVTENLNDCPELLDLAHAHGITDDILARLDRPQPSEPKPRIHRSSGLLDARGTFAPPLTTADVPAALRGPHWKP